MAVSVRPAVRTEIVQFRPRVLALLYLFVRAFLIVTLAGSQIFFLSIARRMLTNPPLVDLTDLVLHLGHAAHEVVELSIECRISTTSTGLLVTTIFVFIRSRCRIALLLVFSISITLLIHPIDWLRIFLRNLTFLIIAPPRAS